MKNLPICLGMLMVMLALAGCSPSEPQQQPSTGLSETIQRPLDRAESVNDTLMRSHQERERQLEQQR